MKRSKPPAFAAPALLALYAISGFSVLTLEMIWMREISLRVGNTVVAATMVFAVFFTAAALGNLAGAMVSRRSAAPLVLYGGFELLAGSAAIGTFAGGQWLWRHWDPGLSSPSGSVWIAILLVGVPSIFSGAAFPNLMQVFVTHAGRRASDGGRFYGANLLGAAGGAAVGGVLFPWWLGLQGAFTVAAGLQIAGGALALCIARRPERGHGGRPARPTARSSKASGTPWGWGLPLLSGVLSLAAQALLMMWTRQILQGSIYAISAVLAAFIGGLGLGALAVGFLRRRRQMPAATILLSVAALAALLLFAMPSAGEWLILQDAEWPGASPPEILGKSLLWSCLWLLPVTACLGGIFPLAWELAFGISTHEGAVAGAAMAMNKLGSALGMVAGSFVILPWLGLNRGICAIGWGYALIALGISLRGRRWTAGMAWAALLIAGAGAWQTLRTPAVTGLAATEQALASYCGPYGEVAVVRDLTTDSRHILLNSQQRLSGTQRALSSQYLQGWIPLLFCRTPERVATIGMASGISSAAMLDFPLKELSAVELVPEVARAAREHFAPWNHRLFTDPRVRLLIGDGRAALNRLPGKFDAIVCDLFFPGEDGTANLYSREFFETVRDRLAPDGVFCLWLPCYQQDAGTAGIVIRTFLDVFPNALAVRSNLDPLQPVVGLLGSARPLPVSRKFLEAQLAAPTGRLLAGRSPFFRSPENAWLLLAGDLHSADPGFENFPATTDDHPSFLFLGSRVSADSPKLAGMTFLNWIGRRFVRPLYPSCALDGTPPEEILASVRAANFYFAAALAASAIPGDVRTEEVRRQQTTGYFRKAQELSPGAHLPPEALDQ
ncbi:MAG: fused MFS/spermidine synthase [Terrimicrobiaceae bacterium]|nr:fused MFS/spermidine synthase [Terrimicrobiaceae bacterium]